MGLYWGGLIIGGLFANEISDLIWGGEGAGGGGGLIFGRAYFQGSLIIIGILWYLERSV